MLGHPMHQWPAEHVKSGDGHAQHGFAGSSGRGTVVLRHAHQQDCTYVHGTHLGAAARKIVEREGTQPGMRRNREIGSIAFAFWCSVNDRRYERMICGMVMRSAAEKFCSAISICRSEEFRRWIIRLARLPGWPT